MFNLFGKKKAEPTPRDSIIKLRETLDTLDKREAHIESKINKELATAKKYSKTNRRQALAALKRKKVYENQLNQLAGSRMTLEQQIMSLEMASTNVQVLEAARAGAAGLRQAHNNMTIDDVEDTLDEVREQQDIAAEIGEALSQPLGGLDMDEDDLEAELEAMEQQALDDEFLGVEAPSTSLPSVALPATPNVPTHTPVAAAGETDEERELRELEASMMA
ncbi:charged multivesicular body protein 4a [Thecamonas trahens ATCC 50062]|uniref:Charged multivesicular body protein 4a n=1 Tax=Thecamonas trahens ATCC 50062 TaxID=461836 RepID=A0A0L0DJU9_THETB|nr:charged multivesicular body protein 4a [Thecamonas trahens ATCC 50062]KNC51578.1 charged multivesicular body protein 4a [Thecamonas trahens ATCC 50062]|eukprot:XP_013755980.1 charged multivesicular body protein 4a [Thecamonas trahens ATCC 50062]